ncbi:hypothetical protein [Alicyclobacillus fastidiosus]|uniref:hypothetical protein n=1 Tax=Alicyclobacillus fastidiosus TaxID=392011 RepID=UPI0024E0D677|nr:hypothetical protein [Alicyclobacillus fastidiosus]
MTSVVQICDMIVALVIAHARLIQSRDWPCRLAKLEFCRQYDFLWGISCNPLAAFFMDGQKVDTGVEPCSNFAKP